MKNLINYLSKKSLSLGNGSGMTRKRLGNGSGMTRFSLVSLICLCMLTVGVGNVWGAALGAGYTKITDITSLSAGDKVVLYCDDASVGVTGYSGSDATVSSTEANWIQFTVEKSSSNYFFKTGTNYIKKQTSNKFTIDATSQSDNYCTVNANGVLCINSRYLCKNGSYYRMYTSIGSYKPFYVYKVAASCTKKVTITKGTPETGGSFSLDKTGEQNCCDALTVTVSSIVAPSGKKFSAITQSGIVSGVTINQSAKTVTYAANTTGSSTINVTYEAKGCEDKGASSITSTSGGNSYTYGPVDEYYKYSTRQILYSKNDLGLSSSTKKGTIKSIYFKYKHTAAMTSKTSVNIYMANTHLTSLSTSSYVPYSEFTLVYSGSLNCTTTNDWNEFFLDTPFEYNGAGNLVVMIDDNSNAYDGNSFTFYYHAATGAQIYTCSDSDNENPATTDWSGYTATSNRPTTKFCIQEADMVQSTVTWVAGSNPSFGSQTDYEGTALSDPGTPSAASYCPGGKVFVGWTETPIVGEGDEPADLFTSVSGKSIPVGGTTYYAVFATSGSSSKTYQFDITPSQFNTTSYTANNNQKSNTATATDASGATMTVYWTSNQIMKSSSDMQWQKNNGYIYNSTDLGTVNSVTVTSSAGGYSIWYGTTEHPTSGSQGSGKGFFTVKENNTATGKSTQVRVNFTKTITSYSNYATSCCTALGTINGSVNLTTDGCGAGELKATWKMLATTGIASQTLRVYDENLDEVSAKRITGITASTSNQTKTISGLNPCKEYYVTVENVSSGGEYCAPGDPWESNVVTTLGYTYTITKNNVSLKGGESEAARACEDFMAEYVANTGYALPTTISVSGASAYEWEDGVLSIEKANVTGNVTVTISGTCVEPAISAGPADANYYVGDSPTPLSVTATLASGTLTYLWKVSTNGGSTWSDAEGTNNAATYSGASLSAASAGTLKFKCIVGNSQGGCTVESGVATITVTAASYFVNGETVFIQADSKDYSAWKDDACVKAWFNNNWSGGSAETTYWLFDATDTDAGKKLFATVVPASGDLNIVQLQRFAGNCSDKWNDNGSVNKASSNGVNTFRSYGSADNNVAWNGSSTILYLYGSQNSWESSLGTFADQGAGVWTATISNYTPDATSKDYKIKTSYNNGWIGNTGSNNNATLSDMKVGSTYNVTATLNVTTHALTMSKTFVKGTVHFDLQGHGLAISDLENVAAGSKISAPSAPSATGYTFGGWFTDPECTDEWTFATDEVEETMTLYAKWTANVYTITKTFSNVTNASLPASFTYTGSTTTALNSTFAVDATNFFLPSSITVTMGGTPLTAGTDYTYNNSTGAFTFDKIISGDIVITATATAKLLSIAITTQPTTRKYFAGESFSSTGAVVTATMGAGTKTVSATWTPSGALSAGTSQTVTASYTENGITKTATTTIDVYSVTVNKVNEDGDAIDVAGVTATWTVGTKALAAGVGSTKYVFKEWQVTGASIGSTTSASTTLSSPTANVVVNAVFYKPVTVSWTKGGTAYGTGSPTTEVARGTQWKDLTIPTAPGDATLGACANKFMGWSNCSDLIGTGHSAPGVLFTSVSGITTAINDPIEFKAVFATENSGTWTLDYSAETALSSSTDWGSYGTAYDYTASDGGTWTVKAYKNAGMQINTTKDASIKIPDCSGNITSIVITCSAAKAVGLSASDYTGSGTITYIAYGTDATSQTIDCSSKTATGGYIVPKSGSTSITKIVVNYGSASNYVTQCDANMIRVTYDANGGSTTCENTTTDKTEDYTVCATEPTRDYYTFAGWLCSADDEVYAASATIDDAVIDADFTLTAQWTPITYTITYNYNGGSAQVDPVPATSYTVESSDITLQTPTKGHDRFDGWYENADLSTGGVKTTIPAGSHENKTYYAKWTARHEIIFDADGATTTIYRADDEDLSASVAGQGSVPSDPSAPTACSSKVFVGWSESTIDGETDTEPGDLMKPAAGTVDADKHYYAVWAIAAGSSGTMTYGWEDADATTGWTNIKAGTSSLGSYVSAHGGSKAANAAASAADTQTEVVMIQTVNKIQITALSFYATKEANNTAAASWILQQSDDGSSWEDIDFWNASSVTRGTWTKYELAAAKIDEITSGAYIRIILSTASTSKRDIDDLSISYDGTSYSAYSTSCCDKEVTIGTPTQTGSGTVTFESGGNAVSVGGSVKTCNGSTTITATVTPTNGYQCTVLSFSRSDEAALTPDPAISVPFTGAQSYDLTFEQNADGVTLNTTVTFVALIDHYIDNMHYNTTQNKSGNYGTAPTLSDESKGEQCTGLHYKFIGWIPESDMNMTTGVPTTTANMVAGGATGKYATGTNYYAIWAEEE